MHEGNGWGNAALPILHRTSTAWPPPKSCVAGMPLLTMSSIRFHSSPVTTGKGFRARHDDPSSGEGGYGSPFLNIFTWNLSTTFRWSTPARQSGALRPVSPSVHWSWAMESNHHGSCAFKLMAGKIDKPRKNIQHIFEIKFVSCTLVAIIFVVYSCILMGVVTLATAVMVPLMAGLNGGMSWRWYQCHCSCARVKMSQYSECTKSYASWYGSG